MAASVEVADLSHAYGDVPVVRGMSFALAPGAIGCLLGPSGCGKTTVLRCLAGRDATPVMHVGTAIAQQLERLGGDRQDRAVFRVPARR